MRRTHGSRKHLQKAVASKRIRYLASLAEQHARNEDLALAARYLGLAKRIAMRAVVPLPSDVKRQACHRCGAFLLPAATSRVRIHRGRVIVTCLACGTVRRLPLHQRKDRRQPEEPTGAASNTLK